MANLLFLAHRLPYPPNKGDKVRSYHLLKHLVARHTVHLGSFVDDPDDLQHVPVLKALCADVHVQRLRPLPARIDSLLALAQGRSLTERYYRHAGLQRWVDGVLARGRIDAAVIFSSAMAQYVHGRSRVPMLLDFVDVDSAKWMQYGDNHAWPLSWLYRREGTRLLRYERELALAAKRSFFVTPRETELFVKLAPDCAGAVECLGNGVAADYFAPDAACASPFAADETALVFTGAMDYWPNIDAVTWFVQDMLPRLRQQRPSIRFHIVGRSPTAAVRALAGPAVSVTGTVPDVRPYLQHAAVVVAPLRLARGIQNKVLEAMAMARPVVASQSCLEPIDALPGRDILGAAEADDFVAQIDTLLASPALAQRMGLAARERVLARYSWPASLAPIDAHLGPAAVIDNIHTEQAIA